MKKVELLAPAGNFEALIGAINAGADGVYLGGGRFGARAYADNFTQEELIEGIKLARLFGVKLYLTVNTLVKEKEFGSLYDFLWPLYEAGLDAVIVQDLGVLSFIREQFPGLSLHASTQMSVTGTKGAAFLKKQGVRRLVPARELSLRELKIIRSQVEIELETFIHGAMCYCYSGQCLFSSILGGRSGNRGRCAQPCRLPYKAGQGQAGYPLSMKDMCTLSILPELIEAGIDSFKIEGRMKKPEYAAGVTSVYRRYIDEYYKNPKGFAVKAEDREYLQSLYSREGQGEGYYHLRNGREMITSVSPAYAGSDQTLLEDIRETFLSKGPVLEIDAEVYLAPESPARLTLTAGEMSVTVLGDVVSRARKQPLSPEQAEKQLRKCGGTPFRIRECRIVAQQPVFLPIGSLNSLRRSGLEALKERLTACHPSREQRPRPHEPVRNPTRETLLHGREAVFHALVRTKEQFSAAAEQKIPRIYVDGFLGEGADRERLLEYKRAGGELFLAFPYIVREEDGERMERLYQAVSSPLFDGALVRSLETLSFLTERGTGKRLVSDACLYAWNRKACKFLGQYVQECCLPVELNRYEWQDMTEPGQEFSVMVYGRLPLMITANCLKKTVTGCLKKREYTFLKDRYDKEFPVYSDCDYCYNVIYNSVPLSLHGMFQDRLPAKICRLDFTLESGENTREVIRYFTGLREGFREPFYREFTTGHYKRGVE